MTVIFGMDHSLIYLWQTTYFYRLHPKSLNARVAVQGEDMGEARPRGVEKLRDEVFVTLFLREAATLVLHSGDTQKTMKLRAGVHHASMPFAPGKQRFVLQRAGETLIDKTGEHEISASDSSTRFNYFAGSASAS